MYNFVTTHSINQEFKKSKYYKTDLGRSLSVMENEKRVFRINDESIFIKYYLDKYKSVIYNEGRIGQINFLTDHYIEGNVIVVFYKEKDFIFEHNPKLLEKKGIDGYIGSFIEEIETKYIDEVKISEGISIDKSDGGNPNNIFDNPGNVSYEDIKKYYENRLPKK